MLMDFVRLPRQEGPKVREKWNLRKQVQNALLCIREGINTGLAKKFIQVLLLLFSCSVLSDSLRPHGLQHARLSCPSPSSRSLLKFMSIESVMPSNHLILCYPLLFLPSISPSIRVFSNKLAPCIRWPKYWSFSFSISPSNKYLGLISFSTDWFDLLVTKTQTNFWPTQYTQETGLHPMSHRFSISKAPEAGRGKAWEF